MWLATEESSKAKPAQVRQSWDYDLQALGMTFCVAGGSGPVQEERLWICPYPWLQRKIQVRRPCTETVCVQLMDYQEIQTLRNT